jgi:hypothetical protein
MQICCISIIIIVKRAQICVTKEEKAASAARHFCVKCGDVAFDYLFIPISVISLMAAWLLVLDVYTLKRPEYKWGIGLWDSGIYTTIMSHLSSFGGYLNTL